MKSLLLTPARRIEAARMECCDRTWCKPSKISAGRDAILICSIQNSAATLDLEYSVTMRRMTSGCTRRRRVDLAPLAGARERAR